MGKDCIKWPVTNYSSLESYTVKRRSDNDLVSLDRQGSLEKGKRKRGGSWREINEETKIHLSVCTDKKVVTTVF